MECTVTLHTHRGQGWEARSYVDGEHAVTAWFNGEAFGPHDDHDWAYRIAVAAVAGEYPADPAPCDTGECDRADFRCDDYLHAYCLACGHCACGEMYTS